MNEGESKTIKVNGDQLAILAILNGHEVAEDGEGLTEHQVHTYTSFIPIAGLIDQIERADRREYFMQNVQSLRVMGLVYTSPGMIGVSLMSSELGTKMVATHAHVLPNILKHVKSEFLLEQ